MSVELQQIMVALSAIVVADSKAIPSAKDIGSVNCEKVAMH